MEKIALDNGADRGSGNGGGDSKGQLSEKALELEKLNSMTENATDPEMKNAMIFKMDVLNETLSALEKQSGLSEAEIMDNYLELSRRVNDEKINDLIKEFEPEVQERILADIAKNSFDSLLAAMRLFSPQNLAYANSVILLVTITSGVVAPSIAIADKLWVVDNRNNTPRNWTHPDYRKSDGYQTSNNERTTVDGSKGSIAKESTVADNNGHVTEYPIPTADLLNNDIKEISLEKIDKYIEELQDRLSGARMLLEQAGSVDDDSRQVTSVQTVGGIKKSIKELQSRISNLQQEKVKKQKVSSPSALPKERTVYDASTGATKNGDEIEKTSLGKYGPEEQLAELDMEIVGIRINNRIVEEMQKRNILPDNIGSMQMTMYTFVEIQEMFGAKPLYTVSQLPKSIEGREVPRDILESILQEFGLLEQTDSKTMEMANEIVAKMNSIKGLHIDVSGGIKIDRTTDEGIPLVINGRWIPTVVYKSETQQEVLSYYKEHPAVRMQSLKAGIQQGRNDLRR